MQVRHDVGNGSAEAPAQSQGIVSKWRQKERLKTTAVALVLCLNIGVDPPDVIKISPCARLECWVDPLSMQPPKALETIGAVRNAIDCQHSFTQQCNEAPVTEARA
jgi:regulatory associated protein of mTOR